jgi:hypothetical protein
MSFYDITNNLGDFNVKDPALETRQNVNNLRQYQYQYMGYMLHARYINLPENTTYDNPYIPSEEEVLNWSSVKYFTSVNTGAFEDGGAGSFMTGGVKRYYFRLPLFLNETINGYYPFQQTVIQKFGFKQQQPEDYRSTYPSIPQNYTSNSIPPYFNLSPEFRIERGTEVYLSFYDELTPGYPIYNWFVFRNTLDWQSINALQGPTCSAYDSTITGPSTDPKVSVRFAPYTEAPIAIAFDE